jgi:sialic acid synthase SpsE
MKIIAEIGTSHGGNLQKAFSLIDAASDAGADAVKFQWVYADEILHPDTGFVDLPGGKISLYENFKKLECSAEFFKKCMDYARKKNLLFVCSPFGEKSFGELAEILPDAIKIASPETNHFPLLKKCAEIYKKIPVILSSGVSKLGDIEKALEIITKDDYATVCPQKKFPQISVLHCITSYPAPEDEYNVKCVETLSEIFGVPCGISDHSLDAVLVPVLCCAMGGEILEKHITLSRKTDGLDDKVALEPEQFSLMVHSVRQAESILKKFQKEGGILHENLENSARKEIFRQLQYEFSAEKIQKILGSGIKKLAPSEKPNYFRTNRSLHFTRDMKKGEILQKNDVAVLRTEKILSVGLGAEFLDEILGARLVRDAENGSGVQWSDFIEKNPVR